MNSYLYEARSFETVGTAIIRDESNCISTDLRFINNVYGCQYLTYLFKGEISLAVLQVSRPH
jgi:hypothetical protein